MASIKYTDILDDLLPSLIADPSVPVAENAVKRTVIEFCEASGIWVYAADPLDLTANESAYPFEVPPNTVVGRVVSIRVNGEALAPRSVLWLNLNYPRWDSDPGTPRYFTQLDDEAFLLAPVPSESATGAIVATVALVPTKTSTGFPKWLFSQYGAALIDGALSRLLLMPSRPWSDANAGAYHRARFEAGIATARAAVVSALSSAPLRVSPQY